MRFLAVDREFMVRFFVQQASTMRRGCEVGEKEEEEVVELSVPTDHLTMQHSSGSAATVRYSLAIRHGLGKKSSHEWKKFIWNSCRFA